MSYLFLILGIRIFSIPFLLSFFDIGKEVYTLLRQPSAPCRFFGEIEVRTAWGHVKIPFDKSENVSISRFPEKSLLGND